MNQCECSFPDGDHERWCPLNRDLGATGAAHLGKRYRRYDPSCPTTLLWLELRYPAELETLRAEDEAEAEAEDTAA